ncbi:MAG TPA: vWA domain-containing protein, partial [Polyangiaceae bacterium]
MAKLVSSIGFALATVVACGDQAPPFIADPAPSDAQVVGDVGFGEAGAPTCNAGPGLGVCACTEIGLLTDAPNLYFVLDRSGSMDTNGKWSTVRIVVAQVMKGLGPRANFGVAIFPNPNDDNACAPGLQVMSTRPGDAPAGTQGPTTSAMLAVTAAPPEGGTPTAASLNALLPTLSKLPGRTFVILATDGGPN